MGKTGDSSTERRTAADVLIDRFLKDVKEKGTMPWQRPYECFNSFNYFTLETYKGFNRILLPFGEYMTKNQINDYNKKHNEDFRFQKGIQWYPVCFFNTIQKPVTYEEISELFDVDKYNLEDKYIGRDKVWSYWMKEGKYIKQKNILRYHDVAERKYFKNSKGEMLPSRIEQGIVEITKLEPKRVIMKYIEREGVHVDKDFQGIPCYVPSLDLVRLNPYVADEDGWFSTAFHEFGHSTGAKTRLNRIGVTYENVSSLEKKSVYAVEECIAEICAYLCCAECGVYSFKTSESMQYDNNIAYVQSWSKRIKDFGKEFFYICSSADKAFNYIVGE